jgi:MSHA biogenesis protein MshO
VRVSGNYMEFVPIRDAGRYRAAQTPALGGDILDFTSAADSSFDILGPSVAVSAGDQLVVYNLGIPGADVYAGDVRRAIPAGGIGAARSNIVFTPTALALPRASPMNRFHIVGAAVSYQCDVAGGVLRRYWGYGFVPVQPTPTAPPATGSSAILVDGVTACVITYAPGVQQRNGIVSISLTLSGNGENVTLLQQVDVLNSP